MVYISAAFLVVSSVAAVNALNDWSVPCLEGECQYSLPSSSAGSASGTMKIWGSVNSISDITGAAGWEILSCSPDTEAQDIRLVCKSDDSTGACAHLYQNNGAVGKIVRLPENCGQSAFARVAKAWDSEDQSIPSSIASRVVRRDGAQPTVRALQLDTSWHEIDPSKAGNVNIAIQGANFPGVSPNISTADIATRSSRVFDRGLFDFVGKAVNAIKKLNNFDVDKNKDLPPFDVDQKFNLLNQSISCPPVSASVNIDVEAKAHAVASIGVAASGTIVPPKINDFAITASVTADLDGSLDLTADATGSLDSGLIKIFELGVPGLDFPGILSIGPTFEVNAQATSDLDALVNLNVGLNYHIDKAALTFPPPKGSGGGTFQIEDTPLKLSVSPSVKATGTVAAHLIPRLTLGLSALGDLAKANIFLDLDASASLILTLDAVAEGNLNVTKGVKARSMPAPTLQSLSIATTATSVPQAIHSAKALSSAEHSSSSKVETSTAKATSAVTIIPSKSTSVTMTHAKSTSVSMAHAKSSSVSMVHSKSTTSAMNHAQTTTVVMDHSKTSTTMSHANSKAGSMSHSQSTASAAKATSTDKAKGSATTTSSAGSATDTSKTGTVVSKDGSASFEGCIEIQAGLSVDAGADASFFGIFDKNTKATLFSKDFELFKKCFGKATKKRALSWFGGSRIERAASRRALGLTCPAGAIGDPALVTDDAVKAASLKEI